VTESEATEILIAIDHAIFLPFSRTIQQDFSPLPLKEIAARSRGNRVYYLEGDYWGFKVVLGSFFGYSLEIHSTNRSYARAAGVADPIVVTRLLR
jgi:hypothetical protein